MKETSLLNKQMIGYLVTSVVAVALAASAAGAGTPYFSDNFENGFSKWSAAGDSWQVTDLFYRSFGHCASDSPKGPYPPNANSIMTMKLAHRVDLSKSADPILRFWHRIGVYAGDDASVEISEDYGFTWTALRSYTDTWRSTWSFEQIDLAPHKASPNPILIRFRLRANGDHETWGWDIDDVEIGERDTQTIPFPLFDDFQSGAGNFMLQLGDAWQPSAAWSVSPNLSIGESPNGTYPPEACSDLILAHPIDLSSSCFPVLTFWHRIGVYSGDYGTVDISEDCGSTWKATPLASYTNMWLANWTFEMIDLSAYKSSPILIRFRLRANGDHETQGWDIDDISVEGLFYPCYDLIVQITDIDTSNCPVIRAAVTVTDANGVAITGLDASSFSVYEDDQLQTAIAVDPDTPVIHVVLALDYSGSMKVQKAIEPMEKAAKEFVDLMGVADFGRIIKFANGVCPISEGFTDDKPTLKADIDNDEMACRDTATWLYDAIYDAISSSADRPDRKAVVVITDGNDQRTEPGRSATEVINHALANGVPVFTIGLGDKVDEPVLTTIAAQTGGVYYRAPDPNDLAEVYRKIAGAIKNQYIVTYETTVCKPTNAGSTKHELEILVVDDAAYGQGTKRFSCPPTCGPDNRLNRSPGIHDLATSGPALADHPTDILE